MAIHSKLPTENAELFKRFNSVLIECSPRSVDRFMAYMKENNINLPGVDTVGYMTDAVLKFFHGWSPTGGSNNTESYRYFLSKLLQGGAVVSQGFMYECLKHDLDDFFSLAARYATSEAGVRFSEENIQELAIDTASHISPRCIKSLVGISEYEIDEYGWRRILKCVVGTPYPINGRPPMVFLEAIEPFINGILDTKTSTDLLRFSKLEPITRWLLYKGADAGGYCEFEGRKISVFKVMYDGFADVGSLSLMLEHGARLEEGPDMEQIINTMNAYGHDGSAFLLSAWKAKKLMEVAEQHQPKDLQIPRAEGPAKPRM